MPCPIVGYSINERSARLVAGLVAVSVAGTLFLPAYGSRLVLLFLAHDFAFRAFSKPRWSPLGRLSEAVLSGLGVPASRVDAGPKRFAARIGFGFVVFLLFAAGNVPPQVVATASGVLILFALLESLLGFCVGCHAWTLWYRLGDALRGDADERGVP